MTLLARGALAALVALALYAVLAAILFGFYLVRAPYQQRNALRAQIRQLLHDTDCPHCAPFRVAAGSGTPDQKGTTDG